MSNSLKGAILNPSVVYGKSAYEIAVEKGVTEAKTEEEWLAEIVEDSADKAASIVGGTLEEDITAAKNEINELVSQAKGNADEAKNALENANTAASNAQTSATNAQNALQNLEGAFESAKDEAVAAAKSEIDAERKKALSQINSKVDDLLDVDQGTIAKLSKTLTTEGAKWED